MRFISLIGKRKSTTERRADALIERWLDDIGYASTTARRFRIRDRQFIFLVILREAKPSTLRTTRLTVKAAQQFFLAHLGPRLFSRFSQLLICCVMIGILSPRR